MCLALITGMLYFTLWVVRTTMLYAFSRYCTAQISVTVGASVQEPEELRYIYENHEDFAPLPSFFVLPAMQELFKSDATSRAIPGKEISLGQILHGEQYIEFVGELPYEGSLVSKGRIVEVLDKGSGAAVAYNGQLKTSNVMLYLI